MSNKPTLFPSRAVHRVTLAALALHLVFIARNSFTLSGVRHWVLFDDAMISMHFAANLAHGHGLRWNPGEAPVEGYTNLLWTLIMACVHLLPLAASKTALAVMLLGSGILALNTLVVAHIAHRISPSDPSAAVGAAVLVGMSFPLAYWTLYGMEVGLIALLLDLAVLLVLDLFEAPRPSRVFGLSLLLSALVLTRTDLVMVAVILALAASQGAPMAHRRKVFVALMAAISVTLGVHTAARIGYYHTSVPNTYYLKATGVPWFTRVPRGVKYLVWCGLAGWWAMLVPLACQMWTARRARPSAPVALLGTLVAAQIAYSVWVGGDAWEYLDMANRYISVVLGLIAVLASAALSRLCHEGRAALVLRALALVAALGMLERAVEALVWPALMGLASDPRAARGLSAVFIASGLALAAAALSPVFFARMSLRGAALGAVPWVCALMLLVADARRWGEWIPRNCPGYEPAIENTRLGLLVGRATAPGTHFAEFSAGVVTYFAQRPMIDLLGKCDPVVARRPPAGPFWPGHNKWDFDYSIGTLRPAVVTRLWNDPTNDPLQPWDRWGYDRLPNGMHVRRDARGVDRAALGAPWRE